MLSLTYSGAVAQNSEPYVIGLTGDLSGPSAGTYKPLAEGARIYFDALNAKGGINGHPVKLLTRDSRGDPNQVVSDLNYFDGEKVSGVLFISPSGTLGALSGRTRPRSSRRSTSMPAIRRRRRRSRIPISFARASAR